MDSVTKCYELCIGPATLMVGFDGSDVSSCHMIPKPRYFEKSEQFKGHESFAGWRILPDFVQYALAFTTVWDMFSINTLLPYRTTDRKESTQRN